MVCRALSSIPSCPDACLKCHLASANVTAPSTVVGTWWFWTWCDKYTNWGEMLIVTLDSVKKCWLDRNINTEEHKEMWKAPPPKEKKESLLALFLYTHQFYITPPKTKKQPDYVCFLFWFTFFLCSCFFRLNSSSTSCLFFWAIPKLFQLTKQTCIIIHPTIHLRDFWNDQFAQITWTLLHAGMFQSGF